MPSFNKVILAGNLTRDPELRYLPKGTAIARISLAINRKWNDPQSGESREEVTFVECDAFGKQAETVAKHFKKGKGILLEGRLKLETWDDKTNGQKRSKLGVVMESFSFLESANGPSEKPAESQPKSMFPFPKLDAPKSESPAEPEDDSVPF